MCRSLLHMRVYFCTFVGLFCIRLGLFCACVLLSAREFVLFAYVYISFGAWVCLFLRMSMFLFTHEYVSFGPWVCLVLRMCTSLLAHEYVSFAFALVSLRMQASEPHASKLRLFSFFLSLGENPDPVHEGLRSYPGLVYNLLLFLCFFWDIHIAVYSSHSVFGYIQIFCTQASGPLLSIWCLLICVGHMCRSLLYTCMSLLLMCLSLSHMCRSLSRLFKSLLSILHAGKKALYIRFPSTHVGRVCLSLLHTCRFLLHLCRSLLHMCKSLLSLLCAGMRASCIRVRDTA